MSSPPSSFRRPALELLAASFVVLFQELALIRWLPGQVRVTAYFPNLVLIAAFLGLGVGALRSGRRSVLWVWPVALTTLTAVAVGLGRIAFTHESSSEELWLFYADLGPEALVVPSVRAPLVLLFVLTAVTFVPLGQYVGDRLEWFRRRSSALWGYVWDLSGSLLGVVAFAVVSFTGSFPIVWFAIFLTIGALLVERRRRSELVLFLVCAAAVSGLVVTSERASSYSPYYAIETLQAPEGPLIVLTNGALHQMAMPLRRSDPSLGPEHDATRDGYHLPYELLEEPPERVLVLGAGTGNDVAVALDEGAASVDAIEIDPVILELGREGHPDRPYESDRVTVHATDARGFVTDTSDRYDLVVFGTLDSMTKLSALANVRLDNFVYTLESLRSARDVLEPDGGLVMYFQINADFIDAHLTSMVTQAFGEPPVVIARQQELFNRIYLAGPAFDHLPRPEALVAAAEELRTADVPTDDWPYLYLDGRGLSSFYVSLIVIFLGCAVIGVLAASPELRRSITDPRRVDGEMFLYGLAFLLLETRAVTEMSLVWGATWLTSAVVFASILGMILVSTIAMQVRPLTFRVAALGLIVSLAVTWALPAEILVGRDPATRFLLSALFVGTPIFFAAACFALRFKVRDNVAVAFGWNLLGAVAGGLAEFLSMSIGLRSLLLVVALGYLASFLRAAREARASSLA